MLLSPIAHEDLKNPHITDGKKNNENIKLYTDAMAELAGKHGVVFADLFAASKQLYEASSQPAHDQWHPFERRGLSAAGTQARAGAFWPPAPAAPKADLNALHAAVQEKNLQFFYDYRAVNGCYIYGGRKAPFGVVNFPAEFAKLRKMIENRERRIWDIAQGKSVPATIDDSDTGGFVTVKTNVNAPDPHHDPGRGTRNVYPPRGLRDQPVRFRSRVSRPGRSGLDDFRRQGPALGRNDGVVPDVFARDQAQ